MSWQLADRRQVLGLAALAAWLGGTAGLWGPRSFLRRRLGTTVAVHSGAKDPPPVPVELGFAATLCGALSLGMGVALLLLFGLLAWTEAFRGLIVEHFLLPRAMSQLLIAGPGVLGLAAIAALVAVNLLVQRGWLRLACGHGGACPALVDGCLLGLLLATILLLAGVGRAVQMLVALAACFMAAGVAAFRSLPGQGRPETRRPPAKGSQLGRPAATTVLAASAFAAALLCALLSGAADAASAARVGTLASSSALAAALLTRRGLQVRPRTLPKLALLATAGVWAAAAAWPAPKTFALSLVTCAASGVVLALMASRQLELVCSTSQQAITFQAWCALTAAAAVLVVGGLSGIEAPACSGLPAQTRENPAPGAPPQQSVALAALCTLASQADGRCVGWPTGWCPRASWLDVDLDGSRYSVIVLVAADTRAESAPRRLLEKSVTRCRHALAAQGCLVVSPAESRLAALALASERRRPQPPSAYLLRVELGQVAETALVIGPHATHRFSTFRLPEGCSVTVTRIGGNAGQHARDAEPGGQPDRTGRP